MILVTNVKGCKNIYVGLAKGSNRFELRPQQANVNDYRYKPHQLYVFSLVVPSEDFLYIDISSSSENILDLTELFLIAFYK